jgi:hypothetical protein
LLNKASNFILFAEFLIVLPTSKYRHLPGKLLYFPRLPNFGRFLANHPSVAETAVSARHFHHTGVCMNDISYNMRDFSESYIEINIDNITACESNCNVGYDIVTEVTMVFWIVMPYSSEKAQCFGGTHREHRQG